MNDQQAHTQPRITDHGYSNDWGYERYIIIDGVLRVPVHQAQYVAAVKLLDRQKMDRAFAEMKAARK